MHGVTHVLVPPMLSFLFFVLRNCFEAVHGFCVFLQGHHFRGLTFTTLGKLSRYLSGNVKEGAAIIYKSGMETLPLCVVEHIDLFLSE